MCINPLVYGLAQRILVEVAPTPTTIPTSFVPKQPVHTGSRYVQSGGNTFLMLSLIILGISILGAGGVFGYERYLISVRDTKSATVQSAQENIDASTVEDFIRTRDRFTAAQGLLNNHVAVSNFFDLLESLTLQNVRFSSLSFTLTEDRSAEIQMNGTARTFNALAAQSSAFASEKRIKRAIFSDIKVNDTKTVSFSLAADIDPKLLALTPETIPALPVEDATTASSSQSTTTTPTLP